MARKYWLMKCEPAAYTIEQLARDGKAGWEGVRNYQARNFMRDEMKVGDGVLFYASNADPSGVTGLAEIVREGYPDPLLSRRATSTTTSPPRKMRRPGTPSTSASSKRSRPSCRSTR